ncbi:MAG TPA: mitochondrial fission ELM1 family protein [Acetobacteraceae bacterium]|nr:mitochondrial fission ELM1 family protein [Acetobacteraceae bacterium]
MPQASWILSEPYAGLQAQALGLAEAAGLSPELRPLVPRAPWRWFAAAHWPAPLRAVDLPGTPPGLVFTPGGVGAAVGAALRRRGQRVVQVQNPRMDIRRFDLVVVNRHDELTGPNVLVTRTALHRATPERLAAARAEWAPRLAHLRRPLVAVLVGGSNGRFQLEAAEGAALARDLAALIRRDGVSLAITPSRRTAPAVRRILEETLAPLGAWVWDMQGENPYFGLLGLADGIVATMDSVSMISEAVATEVPVMVVELPGRSRRIGLFLRGLIADGRVRPFHGRFETWTVRPLDDTREAAEEMRRRLGI